MSFRMAIGVWASMMGFLVACDQADPNTGGDGDGDSMPPADLDASTLEEVTTAEHTYPLVPGSRWVYAHRGGSEPWDEEVQLVTEQRDGAEVLVLRDTAGPSGSRSESVLREVGSVAYRVSKQVYIGETLQARAEYDPGFARHDLRWTQRSVGYSESLSYDRREWDGNGQLARDGDRAHVFTVEDKDVSVSVPAGDFEGCLLIHRLRDRGVGTPLDEADDKRFWYCPGIGKVKEVEDATGKSEELVECVVPGGACP